MEIIKAFEDLQVGSSIYSVSCNGCFREYRVTQIGEPLNKLLIPIAIIPIPASGNPEFIVVLGRRACSDKFFVDKRSKEWEWLFTDLKEAEAHYKTYYNRLPER